MQSEKYCLKKYKIDSSHELEIMQSAMTQGLQSEDKLLKKRKC